MPPLHSAPVNEVASRDTPGMEAPASTVQDAGIIPKPRARSRRRTPREHAPEPGPLPEGPPAPSLSTGQEPSPALATAQASMPGPMHTPVPSPALTPLTRRISHAALEQARALSAAQALTDEHEINARVLCERADICNKTLRRHVMAALIEQGVRRTGVAGLFWTRPQVNAYLRRIGKGDRALS